MKRRRVLLISLCLSLAALPAGLIGWHRPALSRDERQLLGRWMAPEPVPRARFVTSKGPVANPRRIWELRRDRSFHVWVVAADDPAVAIHDKEGLWSAGGGKLHVEGFGAMGDAWREARERIRIGFGGAYVARSSGRLTHSVRFIDSDTWEMTTVQGETITWKRRP